MMDAMSEQSPSHQNEAPCPTAGAEGFALFATALGTCAVAWGERGIVRVLLPAEGAEAVRAQMSRDRPTAIEQEPPAVVAGAVVRIRALLDGAQDDDGARDDLTDIPLDWRGVSDFHHRVYDIARTIEPGTTLTYGEVAHRLGDPGAAQAVGQALGRNPFPIVVPCHRVLAADHALHGFSAPGGIGTKARLLEIERTPGFGEPMLF